MRLATLSLLAGVAAGALAVGSASADIIIATAGPMTGQYAAFGEQITIWNADSRSARVRVSPRSVELANSSRSRNTGARRSGTWP